MGSINKEIQWIGAQSACYGKQVTLPIILNFI